MNNLKLGIIGASGLVGQTLLKVLKEYDLIPEKLFLFTSKKRSGESIIWGKKKYKYIELKETFINYDFNVLFFSAGEEVSKKFALLGLKKAKIVIDNSSAFRYDPNIPLVVPQINGNLLKNYSGIIANPNCTTIQLVIVLNRLKKFGLKKVIVSTYQAVSGAGKKKLLYLQSNGKNGERFEREIINNLIPKIGNEMPDNYFKEEWKIIKETKKILNTPSLNITATCVRVPITHSHSESITCEFENEISYKKIIQELKKESIIKTNTHHEFSTPIDAYDNNIVYVSRIRPAFNSKKWWNFFIISDNLRRGAATNAVDILKMWGEYNEHK